MTLTPALKSLLAPYVCDEAAEARFAVTNPATAGVLAYVADQGADETLAAIGAANQAFAVWSGLTAKARSVILKKWNELVLAMTDDLAMLVTLEQGRPISETRGEVVYGASFLEWFAEEGKRAYGRTIPATVAGKQLLTIKQPIGVCCAITPWNFPLSMITRKVAPALAVGCTVVIKPSEETPLSALALLALARQAGMPEGVLSVITTTKAQAVGDIMTSDIRVKKLSFTGSTPVGKALYAQCAGTVKKISLELGGNAPFLIFDDADLDAALDGVMASKYRNGGQTCVCANRILVQAGIYDRFAQAMRARVEKMVLGDGQNVSTVIGPLINERAIEKVDQLVSDAVLHGAKATIGGQIDAQGPLFYQPTILTNVTPDMAIFSSEIFGPVAPLFKFQTEDEAIELANNTPFGLAAYAFTRDVGRCMRVAQKLQYGMVGINDGVMSTEVAPFGGIKESGIGREGAAEGLDEYLNLKYISFGGLNA
jgi:succinate-semialdehyde dehydrogenase / glutarate-semialdehyde dehydrogenase